MAEQIKYVSFNNLEYYDEKIKAKMEADDATVLASAKTYAEECANGKDTAIAAAKKAGDDAQADVDALESLVGTLPEGATASTVVGYVDEKTSGIASESALTALTTRVSTAETDIDNLETNKADKTALEAVSTVANAAVKQVAYDAKVAELVAEDARIAGLVTSEETRAKGVEAGLDERLVEVETFFKTAEGETLDQAMDTLVEIQKYITEDGAAADEMVKDIAANAKAIEDHIAEDHDFASADATLKADLQDEIATAKAEAIDDAATKANTAEGNAKTYTDGEIDKVEGTIATMQGVVDGKASQTDLDDAVTRIGINETNITALQNTVNSFTAITDSEIDNLFA